MALSLETENNHRWDLGGDRVIWKGNSEQAADRLIKKYSSQIGFDNYIIALIWSTSETLNKVSWMFWPKRLKRDLGS